MESVFLVNHFQRIQDFKHGGDRAILMPVINQLYLKNLDQLRDWVLQRRPGLVTGSKTSTVIDFENLRSSDKRQKLDLIDLSGMPSKIERLDGKRLKVSSGASWEELIATARQGGRDIALWPTETTAKICAGVATSASGERCFGYGALRDQLVEVEFMNHSGELEVLTRDPLELDIDLKEYRESYRPFAGFKNGPFPRLEQQLDLMVGSEGQLGVVTAVVLETVELENREVYAIALKSLAHDHEFHFEFFQKIQRYRNLFSICEFVDSHSLQLIGGMAGISEGEDLLIVEFALSRQDQVFQEVFPSLDLDLERVFLLSESRWNELRVKIPRQINEINSRRGISKLGTDIQILGDGFLDLLKVYRSWSALSDQTALFGHFGDGHLHFNFMPETSIDRERCLAKVRDLLADLAGKGATPFAEHGLGLLKKPFVAGYWGETHRKVFQQLKLRYDPHNQFFPQGYMSW